MCSLLCSSFSEDAAAAAAGCCNSETNLKKGKRPGLQIICTSKNFSQECLEDSNYRQDDENNTFNGGLCYRRTLFVAQEGEDIPYTPRNGRTCKKIPVKETTSVRHTKLLDGRKMINEYVKERKISRGSYGKVALYHESSDGAPYAVKTICKSRLCKVRVTQSETAMTNVLREVSIMKTLDHTNVVNLVEVINDQKSDYLYMVLEYVDGSSISNICKSRGRIDDRTARRFFKDIIAGLIYLHSHNIVHGDIKPENLLLTSNGRVKIGDFSVSLAFEDDDDKLLRCPGTPAFTAPECCSDAVYRGKAADTWAVGVTLYSMVLGCCPFLADSLPETYERIVNSPLSLPEELDPELRDLLQGLLCKDPMQRINLNSVVEHPWVVREGGPVPMKHLCSCKLSSYSLNSPSMY